MCTQDLEIHVITVPYVPMTREEAEQEARRWFAGIGSLLRLSRIVETSQHLTNPMKLPEGLRTCAQIDTAVPAMPTTGELDVVRRYLA